MSKTTYDYILKRLRLVDPASKINYDNTSSGMTAETVQDAIDEVNTATTNLGNNEKLVTYYETVGGASSGNQVNVPANGTIVLDKFGSSKDAILSEVDGNNNPTWVSPKDSNGAIVTTSLVMGGTYVFSSTPVNSVAVIYMFKIKEIYWSDVNLDQVIYETELPREKYGIFTTVFITSTDSPYMASWGEDINCDCTTGDITVILPTAVNTDAEMLNLVKNDDTTNVVAFEAGGSEEILTNMGMEIEHQYTNRTFISNGTNIGLR